MNWEREVDTFRPKSGQIPTIDWVFYQGTIFAGRKDMVFVTLGVVWVGGSLCFCLALAGMAAKRPEYRSDPRVLAPRTNARKQHTRTPNKWCTRSTDKVSA